MRRMHHRPRHQMVAKLQLGPVPHRTVEAERIRALIATLCADQRTVADVSEIALGRGIIEGTGNLWGDVLSRRLAQCRI